MKILLARHGNTFNLGDKVVWVGGKTDMPLTKEGHIQAKKIGKAISSKNYKVGKIYTGPLLRTVETAHEIAFEAGIERGSLVIINDLREIDYGVWEGKTNDEIRDKYGAAVINGWQKENRWPADFNWYPSEAEILSSFLNIINKINLSDDDLNIIVSSNGIFKIWAKYLNIPILDAKMSTGHTSLIDISDSSKEIIFWNKPPEFL